jgi:NADH-quinone oxidoreductase subunit M
LLLPFIGVIVFTGVYPKPILERIEPSVERLIAHVEDRAGYESPRPVVAEVEPEQEADH